MRFRSGVFQRGSFRPEAYSAFIIGDPLAIVRAFLYASILARTWLRTLQRPRVALDPDLSNSRSPLYTYLMSASVPV